MALTTFVAGNVLTALQLNDSFAAVGGVRAIVPTSVSVTGAGSSGTVGTNGTITFGTAESLSINGVFSSAYRNYAVVCDFDTSAADINLNLRWRVAGTDNTTANSYIVQRLDTNSTTVGAGRVTSNLAQVAYGASVSTNGFTGTIFRPFLADTTTMTTHSANSLNNAWQSIFAAFHNQNTSYDGFTLLASSGNISGTVTVYGLFG